MYCVIRVVYFIIIELSIALQCNCVDAPYKTVCFTYGTLGVTLMFLNNVIPTIYIHLGKVLL